MQMDFDRLEIWACEDLMKSNMKEYMVLHLVWDSPQYEYRLKNEWFESRPTEKGLGIVVDETLDQSQQCVLAAQKDNHILGYLKRSKTSRSSKLIFPLYSALMSLCRFPREVVNVPSLELFKVRLDAALSNLV